jgi:ribosomal protein L34E
MKCTTQNSMRRLERPYPGCISRRALFVNFR